jgi:hypothetical protein
MIDTRSDRHAHHRSFGTGFEARARRAASASSSALALA